MPALPHDLETLWGLLHHPSPSGQEAEAVAYLVQRFKRLGYTRAFRDEAGNAVGVMGHGPRQIVLLGHIDTVPGDLTPRLVEHPDEGLVLYGRGAVDAKGPLAAFTDAVAALGPRPGWEIRVVGAVDEERDSLGARFLLTQADYRPAFLIVGEPSGWERITLGYKGSAWAEVRFSRPLAHTAAEEPSAAEEAVAAWGQLQAAVAALNAERTRAFDRLQPTLRGLASGSDGLSEWASLRIGCRLPLDYPPEAWYALLRATLPQANVQPIGYPIPAYAAAKRTPLVRAFLQAIRAAGGRPGFVYKTGTADLNLAAPAWGCPALAYGPGDSRLDHTPEERIAIAEYRRAVAVLRGVLERLTAPATGKRP